MIISRADLDGAVSDDVLTQAQADLLWERLSSKHDFNSESTYSEPQTKRFNGANVAYYFGALLVISAMTWFMTSAWEAFGGWGIFTIAAIYAFLFVQAGRQLWFKQNLFVPGGLLFTLAVSMVPLTIYGLQRATGLWVQGDPGNYENYYLWVKGSWLPIELSTIAAALVCLRFVKFPFLIAPIAFTLWYMSMDLTPLLFGKTNYSWDERLWVSLVFGMLMLLAAYIVDRRTKTDFTFWLYLFGSFAFWTGLGLLSRGNAAQEFIFLLVNLVFMILAILLRRRLLAVFGSLGVFAYLSDLAYGAFSASLLFPFVLSFIGLGIIFVGVAYQRNQKRLEDWVLSRVPAELRSFLPAHRHQRNR